jgi:type I site-specific restriction endonuclease
MSKQNFDDYLNESLNNLKQGITPNKDLWSGIERALVTTKQSDNTAPIWPKLSAIAACCVAALLSVMLLINKNEPSQVVQISDYFKSQKQRLLVQYKDQHALTTNWQAQLQELEEAEQAIKQALENEPQNQALLAMLAQIYQQQLDLINKVHAPRWQQI